MAPVGGPEDNKMSDENMSEAADKIDERLKTRVPSKRGRGSWAWRSSEKTRLNPTSRCSRTRAITTFRT